MHPASAGKQERPRYPRKATAPPHAAAIQFLGSRTLRRRAARVPPPPWPGYSTLLRAARAPLQPSNCCLHLEQPPQSLNGVDLRHAEGRNIFGRLNARYAMNDLKSRQTRVAGHRVRHWVPRLHEMQHSCFLEKVLDKPVHSRTSKYDVSPDSGTWFLKNLDGEHNMPL